MNDIFKITTMTEQDIDTAVKWARQEGWNPGLEDAKVEPSSPNCPGTYAKSTWGPNGFMGLGLLWGRIHHISTYSQNLFL